jgi:hypothetical protein
MVQGDWHVLKSSRSCRHLPLFGQLGRMVHDRKKYWLYSAQSFHLKVHYANLAAFIEKVLNLYLDNYKKVDNIIGFQKINHCQSTQALVHFNLYTINILRWYFTFLLFPPFLLIM